MACPSTIRSHDPPSGSSCPFPTSSASKSCAAAVPACGNMAAAGVVNVVSKRVKDNAGAVVSVGTGHGECGGIEELCGVRSPQLPPRRRHLPHRRLPDDALRNTCGASPTRARGGRREPQRPATTYFKPAADLSGFVRGLSRSQGPGHQLRERQQRPAQPGFCHNLTKAFGTSSLSANAWAQQVLREVAAAAPATHQGGTSLPQQQQRQPHPGQRQFQRRRVLHPVRPPALPGAGAPRSPTASACRANGRASMLAWILPRPQAEHANTSTPAPRSRPIPRATSTAPPPAKAVRPSPAPSARPASSPSTRWRSPLGAHMTPGASATGQHPHHRRQRHYRGDLPASDKTAPTLAFALRLTDAVIPAPLPIKPSARPASTTSPHLRHRHQHHHRQPRSAPETPHRLGSGRRLPAGH